MMNFKHMNPMNWTRPAWAASAAALLVSLAPAHAQEGGSQNWSVWAETVYTASGDPIQNAMVTVSKGKIVGVAPAPDPGEGSDTLRAKAITPGMIDLSIRLSGGERSVEQSEEVRPEHRVERSVDLFSPRWTTQLQRGITTALLNPVDQNVIGGRGFVAKTGGPETLEARIVKRDVALRGAIGSQPSQGNSPAFGRASSFYNRRPTTRMGVEWEWRKAFYDAMQGKLDEEKQTLLLSALEGEMPLFIQAWTTQDIRTAVFLKEEMAREGYPKLRLIIDAGAEAWREPQLLVRTKTPVVLPPYPLNGRTGDGAFFAMNAAKLLHEAGVPIAFSAHGSRDFTESLAMQAGYAMRGGLDFQTALRGVTLVPAQLAGVDGRVGSIEPGKDADLVLWSGTPFEPSSRVTGVLLDGVLAVDPRPTEEEGN